MYYLRTLEGVRPVGASYVQIKENVANRRYNMGEDLETAVYNELAAILENEGEETARYMIHVLRSYHPEELAVLHACARIENELEAEAARAALDAQRARDYAIKAQAEAEANRDYWDALRARDEQQREQAAAQQAQPAEPEAAAIEQAEQIINEGEMDITEQVVNATPEYTAISETAETVFATDETGAPAVFTRAEWDAMQGKKDAGGWPLVLAAVALFALA